MAQGNGQSLDWLDALVNTVRQIHAEILEESSGAQGEHTARLYAACARPFQTVFGEDAYPTPVEKAAALFHGIITGHVFADGNKRTGTIAALFLLSGSSELRAVLSRLEMGLLGELAVATAEGGVTAEDCARWLARILADRLA